MRFQWNVPARIRPRSANVIASHPPIAASASQALRRARGPPSSSPTSANTGNNFARVAASTPHDAKPGRRATAAADHATRPNTTSSLLPRSTASQTTGENRPIASNAPAAREVTSMRSAHRPSPNTDRNAPTSQPVCSGANPAWASSSHGRG